MILINQWRVVMERKFLNVIEVAKLLNVSISWVKTHSSPSAQNPLPVIWIGGLKRFDADEIMRWVSSANETQPGGGAR